MWTKKMKVEDMNLKLRAYYLPEVIKADFEGSGRLEFLSMRMLRLVAVHLPDFVRLKGVRIGLQGFSEDAWKGMPAQPGARIYVEVDVEPGHGRWRGLLIVEELREAGADEV